MPHRSPRTDRWAHSVTSHLFTVRSVYQLFLKKKKLSLSLPDPTLPDLRTVFIGTWKNQAELETEGLALRIIIPPRTTPPNTIYPLALCTYLFAIPYFVYIVKHYMSCLHCSRSCCPNILPGPGHLGACKYVKLDNWPKVTFCPGPTISRYPLLLPISETSLASPAQSVPDVTSR